MGRHYPEYTYAPCDGLRAVLAALSHTWRRHSWKTVIFSMNGSVGAVRRAFGEFFSEGCLSSGANIDRCPCCWTRHECGLGLLEGEEFVEIFVGQGGSMKLFARRRRRKSVRHLVCSFVSSCQRRGLPWRCGVSFKSCAMNVGETLNFQQLRCHVNDEGREHQVFME